MYPSWVTYSLAVYIGLLLAGSLSGPRAPSTRIDAPAVRMAVPHFSPPRIVIHVERPAPPPDGGPAAASAARLQ